MALMVLSAGTATPPGVVIMAAVGFFGGWAVLIADCVHSYYKYKKTGKIPDKHIWNF